MNPETLIETLCATFSDARLFNAQYVNDKAFLDQSRMHARVCGLLARVGFQLNYLVDFGRKYTIDTIVARNGSKKERKQNQAEADVSYVDLASDKPVILLDYETSDAPIFKMHGKFQYISSFAKYCRTVELIGLFITVTGVLNSWKPDKEAKWERWNEFYQKPREEWQPETEQDRKLFAEDEIPKLIAKVLQLPDNRNLSLLIGVFFRDHLQLRRFSSDNNCIVRCAPYATISDLHQDAHADQRLLKAKQRKAEQS